MVCSLLFIMSLSGLNNQETAKKGNFYGITGMTLAIGATMFLSDFDNNFLLFGIAAGVGGLIGLYLAIRVDMIAMP